MRKRDIEQTVWLNYDEKKRLKENAKKVGLSQSSYIRNLINNHKPKEQPTELIFEFLNQLKGIGINLNQIARKANALDLIDAPYYKRTYTKWRELEEKIKKQLLEMD